MALDAHANAHLARVAARLWEAGCVFAEREAELLLAEASDAATLDVMLRRRVEGEPLEWVVGWAEFRGVRVPVLPGVFVPRPRTEVLADAALVLLRAGDRVLDLGCGAGALALALASDGLAAEVVACDVDHRAVSNARLTLAGTGARALCSDLFAAFGAGERFDLVVANLPYVPTGQMEYLPVEARSHEPRVALDGGADGLDPLRRCAASLVGHLAPGGAFLTEVSSEQASLAEEILSGAGLSVRTRHDGAGTCVVVAGVGLGSPGEGARDAARNAGGALGH